MPSITSWINIWETMKEADLRPLRNQAVAGVRIAIVGDLQAGGDLLAAQMRRDPARPGAESEFPVALFTLDQAAQAARADLVILMMDGRKADSTREQALVKAWNVEGQRVLVFINQAGQERLPPGTGAGALAPGEPSSQGDMAAQTTSAASVGRTAMAATAAPSPGALIPAGKRPLLKKKGPVSGKRRRGVVWGSVNDTRFLTEHFAPGVIELIPDQIVPLARVFPLFRQPVAHKLINDTCFSNATYAFTTGLAETIAVADVPIVLADTFVLTKNQLFLVYKVGLALGYSTRWQDYVAEFGSVLGSGYLLRTASRTLVGLVPVFGLLPKTAIAYAGTFAVGNAVLQWYLTGRHVTGEQMKQLYQQALERGKQVASFLLRRTPRRKPLEPGAEKPRPRPRLRLPRLRRKQ